MISYWEKQSLLHYDIIIIGSGIVGLSTALSIKERDSAKKILVLERGILPTGASTKNAGFACIGSLTEILDDLSTMSEDEVIQLVEMRLKGLRKLRKRLGDRNIEYAENGSYELIGAEEERQLKHLERINTLLKPILIGDAFFLNNKKIKEFGFNSARVKQIVQNNFEGELHTGKMIRTLVDLSISKGIEIKTGCEVEKIEDVNKEVKVYVSLPSATRQFYFSASKVAVTTNAFTKKLFPQPDIKPGRGHVLITKPVKGLKFRGIFHFDKGYYYFREINGRVLFGGGRNLDFEKEQTTEFGFNEKIKNDLTEKLHSVILPDTEFEIDYWWTGIMAFGPDKFPVIKEQSERVFLGVRMGGMGIAIGSETGERLAALILE